MQSPFRSFVKMGDKDEDSKTWGVKNHRKPERGKERKAERGEQKKRGFDNIGAISALKK